MLFYMLSARELIKIEKTLSNAEEVLTKTEEDLSKIKGDLKYGNKKAGQ